jgi:hypothetical protein
MNDPCAPAPCRLPRTFVGGNPARPESQALTTDVLAACDFGASAFSLRRID